MWRRATADKLFRIQKPLHAANFYIIYYPLQLNDVSAWRHTRKEHYIWRTKTSRRICPTNTSHFQYMLLTPNLIFYMTKNREQIFYDIIGGINLLYTYITILGSKVWDTLNIHGGNFREQKEFQSYPNDNTVRSYEITGGEYISVVWHSLVSNTSKCQTGKAKCGQQSTRTRASLNALPLSVSPPLLVLCYSTSCRATILSH
jgi:hypothetical protein